MEAIAEYVDGTLNISGSEKLILKHAGKNPDAYRSAGGIDFGRIKSAAAIALHMQQPLIPAGGNDLRTAEIISNLKYMWDNQTVGDNHNAPVFYWCYKRIGEFIPQLIGEGKQPRAMLEYTGCLFHGLRKMGSEDLFDALKNITVNPDYRHAAEWLGLPVEPCRGPVNAGAGLQIACIGLAASFRRDVRFGGAGACERVLALGDGPSERTGCRV
jgi:hypothetical protein